MTECRELFMDHIEDIKMRLWLGTNGKGGDLGRKARHQFLKNRILGFMRNA